MEYTARLHLEKAEQQLELVDNLPYNDTVRSELIQAAQAHSLIAIGMQLTSRRQGYSVPDAILAATGKEFHGS